jgi:xylulokinase
VTPSSGPHALGIDIGVSGARAAVVGVGGTVVGRARVTRPGGTGAVLDVQDPGQWAAEALGVARQALAEASVTDVAAIGVAALGPAPVLVDAQLRPLLSAPLFMLHSAAEDQRRRLLDVLGLDGAGMPPGHPVAWLQWWRRRAPAAWHQAALAMDVNGFVVSALTGVPTMDLITALDYSVPGMPCPLPIPPARDPREIVGGLAAGPAAHLGLAAGTPVVAGTYDSYIDLARMGVSQPGDACILLGSTLVVGQVTAASVALSADSGLCSTPYLGEGQLLGGWTSAGGLTLDWCADVLGAGTGDIWAAAGGLTPGAAGLLALPYLAGERSPVWDGLARGVVVGLTVRTSRLEVCRAFLDSVALSTRDLTYRLQQVAPKPDKWRVSGGGVRNPTWLQATADAVGGLLEVIDEPGGVAAAAHAFDAVGMTMKPPAIFLVAPDRSRSERYGLLHESYRELYPKLSGAMHALAHIDQSGRVRT